MSNTMTFSGWVVTHRDIHDDDESAKRAITDYASNPTDAWTNFLTLLCHQRRSKETWTDRGYVARRVTIKVKIHQSRQP